jgi:HTH-type transcriptional regulator/antitoxin HipB
MTKPPPSDRAAGPPLPIRVSSPKALGQALRAQRKAHGLTQVQAANLCGVAYRFILDLEKGKETAQLGKALQVAARLGLDLWFTRRGHRP